MSKHNKVNPGQYHVGGRLTPDEAARERVKQRQSGETVAATRAGKPAASRGTASSGPRAAAQGGERTTRAAGRK